MGGWIGERLNRCEGPVRFLIPEGGVSAHRRARPALPRPGGRRARCSTRLERTVVQTADRRLIRLP